MFQFLIGRLNTDLINNITSLSNEFQFLIGRLNTQNIKEEETIYTNSFNSL